METFSNVVLSIWVLAVALAANDPDKNTLGLPYWLRLSMAIMAALTVIVRLWS